MICTEYTKAAASQLRAKGGSRCVNLVNVKKTNTYKEASESRSIDSKVIKLKTYRGGDLGVDNCLLQ